MAHGGNEVWRRRVAPERNEYLQTLQHLTNFVGNELNNLHGPRRRLDAREWKVQRAKTIRILKDLRTKLDKVCVSANYGKSVGNAAEIVGAVVAIVGAVMSLFGKASSQEVSNTGKLAQLAGNCIFGVSNEIESYISEKYLWEIQEALEEDKALSRPLAEWLTFSNTLDADVQTIFGVSLTSGTFNTVMKVFQNFIQISNSVRDFDAIIKLMKQGRYSIHIGNNVKIETLEKFYRCLSASPELAKLTRRMLPVLSSSAGGVELCIDGVRTYNGIMGMCSSSVVPTLQGGLIPEIPTTLDVSVFCGFQAISLASSVISIINTQNIISNGTSKYSDALERLISSLAWELERMENLE